MDAADPDPVEILEEAAHVAQRIDAVDAGDHGRGMHLREHFPLRCPEDKLVGVEDRQHAGERAVALHAEIAGVVDADQVDAAALDEFCGDAVAGAGHDEAAASIDLRAQSVEAILPGVTDCQAHPAADLSCMSSMSVVAASVAKAGSLI